MKNARYIDWVFLATLVAAISGISIGVGRLSGILLISTMALSTVVILARVRYVEPRWLLYWVPFLFLVYVRTDLSNVEEILRAAMLTSPVLVGAASSSIYGVENYEFRRMTKFLLLGSVFFYVVAFLSSGNNEGLVQDETNWFQAAGASMTYVLLSVIGMAYVDYGDKKFGYILIISSLALCVFSESRTPVLVIPIVFFCTNKNFSVRQKVVAAVSFFIVSMAFLSIPVVRESVLKDDSASVTDVFSFDATKIKSGGRLSAWPDYIEAIPDFVFGGGGVASANFGRALHDGAWAHPHNEYIRLVFDYGLVGMLLYLFPIFFLIKRCGSLRHNYNENGFLASVAFKGFVAYLLLCATGNALLYVNWYGNLLFMFAGLALRGFFRYPRA